MLNWIGKKEEEKRIRDEITYEFESILTILVLMEKLCGSDIAFNSCFSVIKMCVESPIIIITLFCCFCI